MFERLLSRQLLEFFDNILSKFQYGFRKDYETQHCLILMLEICKGATDNNKAFGQLLTELSKVFNCLIHDLLIVINILQEYLSNCKQKQKLILFIALEK